MLGVSTTTTGPWSSFADRVIATFSSDPTNFSSFFQRVLRLLIDPSTTAVVKTQLLVFVIGAYQSLDTGIIRKECASLVSIGIWHNLHSEEVRQQLLGRTVQLGKAWRAAGKRYDAADAETQVRLRFERSWLFSVVLDFANVLYEPTTTSSKDAVLYCERMVEFLADLLSQLPTRRYVNTLLADFNIIPVIVLSPVYADDSNVLFRDLTSLLQHYMSFPIEDHSGREYTDAEESDRHNARLSKLQRVAFKVFKDKLTILALSNYKSLASRTELEGHLAVLTDEEVKQLCEALQIRTEYPATPLLVRDRQFYLEVLVHVHERRISFKDAARDRPVLPTEEDLYKPSFEFPANYNGSQPLAIPKLNLQYLTVSDFLWRSFVLYRNESFFEIRDHLEDTVRRLQPRRAGTTVRFDGFSKMALPISKPAIVNVAAARVGELQPSVVEVEVSLDVSKFTPNVRREWESLRTDDVVYLVAVQPQAATKAISNGGSTRADSPRAIKYLRCAEVLQVLDADGKALRDRRFDQGARVRTRKLLLKLDAKAYYADQQSTELKREEIYGDINLIVRRRGRENNFKSVLESIQHLVLSDTPAPSWLQEVFLGYSDPSAATWKNMPNKLHSVDYRDTFLDWPHLIESLPGKTVEPDDAANGSFPPPYVLETVISEVPVARPSKKRRKEVDPPSAVNSIETIKVSTYTPESQGPYLSDTPKTNSVRFTPAQVEAITSGLQPGLSVVLGPPGTGKTDVATQIVSNLYHNFPQERILLIAHSNQALNQLFQKITALDIDERHLLRLGHGEEELETDINYSKAGRIESLMEKSATYLAEVNRLAASIGAPGAHGNSCATAEYFDQVYIKPAWNKFWASANSTEDPKAIVDAFPFHHFFVDAPQPVFPKMADRSAVIEIAKGCERHISHIFTTLSEIRPFELLRSQRDKSNYLLLHTARIVAMTSTHAAMRRSEISSLGFRYDNIIIEEAAQITEIEGFIPFALQKPKDGDIPLKRIVLVGDHLQNSPVVQNQAFRLYANLDQSMFSRLTRLGVPTILLDAQGRARPSLAALYSWRYPKLHNLPLVSERNEFLRANAGFRHPYQFIDVQAYKGKGEAAPVPHVVHNLGEAEYAVAIYQYMRLLGYPASSITILTMYTGQKALIRDVLNHRCRGNRLFGMPRSISTVDRYQGEQNDYVILSLVRTERVGYLRDLRRLTVALSRARLGLYIVGRRELFESVLELRPVFEKLFGDEENVNKLALVTGEMFPAERLADNDFVDAEEGKVVYMEGVEHLGQYVYEMTKAKVEDLKKGATTLPMEEIVVGDSSDEEDEEEAVEDDVEDSMEMDGE